MTTTKQILNLSRTYLSDLIRKHVQTLSQAINDGFYFLEEQDKSVQFVLCSIDTRNEINMLFKKPIEFLYGAQILDVNKFPFSTILLISNFELEPEIESVNNRISLKDNSYMAEYDTWH